MSTGPESEPGSRRGGGGALTRILLERSANGVEELAAPQPWERKAGESIRAYHAFECYLQMGVDRTLHGVAERLGRKRQTIANMSSRHRWVSRIEAWEHHQSGVRLQAAEAEIGEMAKRHAQVANAMMGIVSQGLVAWNAALREKNPPRPSLKDLTGLAKVGADIERWSRGLLALEDPAVQAAYLRASSARGQAAVDARLEDRGPALDAQQIQAENWRHTYVQPEGAFLPHRMQSAAIRDHCRFLTLVAGVQSGKTAGGAISFWRRIQDDRPKLRKKGQVGFYWMIAPNAPVGEVMCEAFEDFAPPGEILSARGQAASRTWELHDGTRVQFRSGEHADKLVGRRVHGAWLDEFTILKAAIWTVSVRQRLATTGGWAIFTGTPRGENWAYHEIWKRSLKGSDSYDPEFAGYTWPSKENPAIDPKEVESARRQLPPAFFRREWEASWEAFHGQIYTGWRARFEVKGLAERALPAGSVSRAGKDFGFSTPGCLLVGHKLPNGEWWIVDEVYEAEKLPSWWSDEIAERWRTYRLDKIFADPAEAEQIAALAAEGIPIERGPNPVMEGIRHVASMITQARVLVDPERCPRLCAQLKSYRWADGVSGLRKEEPHKVDDHAPDALRYLLMGDRDDKPSGTVSGYGSATPARRRHRRTRG